VRRGKPGKRLSAEPTSEDLRHEVAYIHANLVDIVAFLTGICIDVAISGQAQRHDNAEQQRHEAKDGREHHG
jgi:hypothetical protein